MPIWSRYAKYLKNNIHLMEQDTSKKYNYWQWRTIVCLMIGRYSMPA